MKGQYTKNEFTQNTVVVKQWVECAAQPEVWMCRGHTDYFAHPCPKGFKSQFFFAWEYKGCLLSKHRGYSLEKVQANGLECKTPQNVRALLHWKRGHRAGNPKQSCVRVGIRGLLHMAHNVLLEQCRKSTS